MDLTTLHAEPRVQTLELIGVAEGRGARDDGCRDGPDALLAGGLAERLGAAGVPARWRAIVAGEAHSDVETIGRVCERVADQVSLALRAEAMPAVLGGDHSCAVGTWNGVHAFLRPAGRLGLIWVDAHMDSHVPQTSPSGRYHGMPLAHLLGHGADRLVELGVVGPVLDPAHLVLVGVRSYEAGEAALLERLGVRVVFMDEVRRRGLASVMDEARTIAGGGTAGFGLSIDLDAVDPAEAPGVGSPVTAGLAAAELVDAVRRVGADRRVAAVEIVEYNPHRDVAGRTARLVGDLLLAAHDRRFAS